MTGPIFSEAALADLRCDRCGYDLRATPAEGRCPECGHSVEESHRAWLVPRRPSWRDSDARWRRRMLAGVWVLSTVPLMKMIRTSDWASRLAVPSIVATQGPITLSQTYLTYVYDYLVFCIGIVLLFSKERGRRPQRLDWSRRWGVLGSYGVALLGIPYYAFISALVLIGIGAVFQSIPLRYQPTDWVIRLAINLGAGYMYYGIHPSRISDAALPAFSALVVLLACVALYNALRATSSKAPVVLLLLPLVIGSAMQLFDVATYGVSGLSVGGREPFTPFYFSSVSVDEISSLYDPSNFPFLNVRFRILVEVAKWLAIVAIAVWLTGAQFLAWFTRPRRQKQAL